MHVCIVHKGGTVPFHTILKKGHKLQMNFTNIDRGDSSGYPLTSQMVICNQEQWEQVWQAHTSELIPPPSLPKIDFDCDQVIAVFAGEKQTSGYAVEIVGVETRTTGKGGYPLLVLKIRYSRPGAIVQDIVTRPYHIIKVPRVDAIEVAVEQV